MKKQRNFMSELCAFINKTHAGWPSTDERPRVEVLAGNPGEHFQRVKEAHEFRKHLGNPTGRG